MSRTTILRRCAFSLVLQTILAAEGSAQQQAGPPNGDFSSSDLSWWQLPDAVGVDSGWSEFGNPGGSFFIETSAAPPDEFLVAHGPCIDGPPGDWTVFGDIYLDAVGDCRIDLIQYTGTACDTSPVVTISLEPYPISEWFERSDLATIDETFRSFRLSLINNEASAAGTCYFDNLVLGAPAGVPQIPTISGWAVGALALALMAVAVRVLRGRTGRRFDQLTLKMLSSAGSATVASDTVAAGEVCRCRARPTRPDPS